MHAPVPAGQHEVIASWGFADERQSWTWDVAAGDPPLSVNVYSQHSHVQLLLNGKPADVAQPSPVAVSRATDVAATTVPSLSLGLQGKACPLAVPKLGSKIGVLWSPGNALKQSTPPEEHVMNA